MTNKKATKRALTLSIISMLICVVMLAGTTFAWFTDSVVSGRNQIVAGNLDVELEYKTDWDNDWAPVTSNTKLFKEGALYEPGYTEVVYFRVSNKGSLALKYNLDVNVVGETTSTNVNNEEFKLSDYLEIGTYVQDEFSSGANYADILMPTMFGTREAALNTINTNSSAKVEKLSEFDGVISENAPVLPGTDTAMVGALVLTMPTTVGNEANHKTGVAAPTIDLGVTLLATQFTHEEDSFDNQYDNGAVFGDKYVTTAQELQEAIDTVKDGEVIAITADITGDVVIEQPGNSDLNFTINGNGHKYDGQIKIKGNSNFDGVNDDSLVIKNINFETSTEGRDFIWSADSQNGSFWRYAHNVTIQKCTFTATGAAVHTAVGARFQQAYNIKLVDCVATGVHSLLQAESCGSSVGVYDSKVVNGKNGVSLNNTMDATVVNTVIESVAEGGYGIRHKGEVKDYSLTVKNCTVNAFVPVLVRNLTAAAYTANFEGTNTLTATNDFGYQVVLSAGDWDNDSAQPSAPTGNYTLTGADSFTVFKG